MSIRNKLGTALDILTEDEIRTFVKEAVAAEKDDWVTCTNCRKRTPVKAKDFAARARVLEILSNQAYGRPAETETDNTDQAAQATLTDLDNLTDLELARLLRKAESHGKADQHGQSVAIPGAAHRARARESEDELPPAA